MAKAASTSFWKDLNIGIKSARKIPERGAHFKNLLRESAKTRLTYSSLFVWSFPLSSSSSSRQPGVMPS